MWIVGGLAFVIWIATSAILDAMKKAADQRNAHREQLEQVVGKLNEVAFHLSQMRPRLPREPTDPDSWWGRTFESPNTPKS